MKLLTPLLLTLLLGSPFLDGANRVFVKPEASDEYLIERARDPSKKVQTYQIMKGNYHPGSRMDPGLEKMTFEELAYDLAIQLRKQDYYPTQIRGESDLLIVVHYGSTGSVDTPKAFDGLNPFAYEVYDELGDNIPTRGLEGYSSAELVNVTDYSYNAQLLGMEFGRAWADEKRLLSILSSESRYFVVLYAYDFNRMQEGEIKLLWRTRYSIRATGQSFDDAISHMNRIASDYMGKKIKGNFVQKRVDDSAFVSFGEIEVIDEEEVREEDREKDFLIYDKSEAPSVINKLPEDSVPSQQTFKRSKR